MTAAIELTDEELYESAHATALADFLADRIAEMPAEDRPGMAAREDLARRLAAAARPLDPDRLEFVPEPVFRHEVERLARAVEKRLRAEHPGLALEEIAARDGAGPTVVEARERPEVIVPAVAENRLVGLVGGDYLRLLFAKAWPRVLLEWREENPAGTVRLPSQFMSGEKSAAALFGKRHRDRAEILGHWGPGAKRGRVVKVAIDSGRTQANLFLKEHEELEDPTPEQLVELVADVLDNPALRFLACCMAAAEQDEQKGWTPGAFWYRPSRLAELHGLPRLDDDGKGRHAPSRIRTMDARLEDLQRVGMTLTVKMAGKEEQLHIDGLIKPGGASVTQLEEGRRGPRSAVLYQVNAALLKLMDSTSGGSFFTVPRAALAAPPGVDQRRWDDCFKVLALLLAHARNNAGDARDESNDNDRLPFARNRDALLFNANVAGPGVPIRNARVRGAELLELLREHGFLAGLRVTGSDEKAVVRYALPPPQMSALAGIRPRRRLAGGRNRRQRRRG